MQNTAGVPASSEAVFVSATMSDGHGEGGPASSMSSSELAADASPASRIAVDLCDAEARRGAGADAVDTGAGGDPHAAAIAPANESETTTTSLRTPRR
jgi:hypothetical protein